MTLELEQSELLSKRSTEREDNYDQNPAQKSVPTNPEEHTLPPAPAKKQKGFLSRSFRSLRNNVFSSLNRLIVFSNILALMLLMITILYMNQFREGLIDAKVESLLTQGKIIASAIAGNATASPDAIVIDPDKLLELQAGESIQPRLEGFRYPINPEQVAPVLRALIKPTQTRARIYEPDGLLLLDSRLLYDGGQILRYDLPPIDGAEEDIGWIDFIGGTLNRLFGRGTLPIYQELTGSGTQYPEVVSALKGNSSSIVRQTESGKLTVSVAVPVQRFRAVLGVLLLSTEGDDIDRIVTEERVAVLRIFLVAGIISLILSAMLAGTIAKPLRRLSEAAIRVKRGVKSRVDIPDFSHRHDEIGNLSTSISEMTNSLYQRIEAIEKFAADVSHELKNPLTSLRSAVETLPLAKTDETRNSLLDIIQHDVKRLDRLITDISDASRLDADLGRQRLNRIDFAELIDNIANASGDLYKRRKGINIKLDIKRSGQGKKGYFVSGHDIRLGQVVNNLLDNASSFVERDMGLISIQLTRNNKALLLVVEDNGPGIQAEDFDRVFERFYTDRSETDGFGQNSGLGLSISRQIIEAHGGLIRAENRTDGQTGARFILSLPLDNQI